MSEITCDTALDRMLEAAPAELRGDGDAGLARHIAGCPRCRAVASALLEEVGAVDDALARFATGDPARAADPHAPADAAADAAAEAALAAVRDEAAGDVVSLDRRRPTAPRGPDRRWLRAAWVPLTAAAALAAVLVFRQYDPLAPGPTAGPAQPVERIEPRVAVTPPPDRGAAILETENPNITIVWLYEREGE